MRHLSFNWDLGRPETIIVLGVGRGGTSVVSGTLRCLGVCMGEDPHPVKHEWSPVVYRRDGQIDVAPTLRNVDAMDAAYPVWGWKSPADLFALDAVLPLLRNPAVIVVTRDLVDVTLSAQNHGQTPWEIGFNESAVVYNVLADRARFWPHPVMVVSFHEILSNAEGFVDLLCAFVQLSPTADKRQLALEFNSPQRNAYRSIAPNSPKNTISPGDLRKDAEVLASVHVAQYCGVYIDQAQIVAVRTKSLIHQLGQMSGNGQNAAAGAELGQRTRQLLARFSTDFSFTEQPDPLQTACAAAVMYEQLEEIIDQALRRAKAVEADIARPKTNAVDGYPLLHRLHRILLLLFALQNEVQRALQHVTFRASLSS